MEGGEDVGGELECPGFGEGLLANSGSAPGDAFKETELGPFHADEVVAAIGGGANDEIVSLELCNPFGQDFRAELWDIAAGEDGGRVAFKSRSQGLKHALSQVLARLEALVEKGGIPFVGFGNEIAVGHDACSIGLGGCRTGMLKQ